MSENRAYTEAGEKKMDLITIREAAEKAGICEMTLRRACADGHVPVIRLGGKRLVLYEHVQRWLNRANGLLTAEAMAERVGLKPSAVMRYWRQGLIPGRIIGKRTMFDEAEVKAALMERFTGGEDLFPESVKESSSEGINPELTIED